MRQERSFEPQHKSTIRSRSAERNYSESRKRISSGDHGSLRKGSPPTSNGGKIESPGTLRRKSSSRQNRCISTKQSNSLTAKKIGTFRPYKVLREKHMSYRKKSKSAADNDEKGKEITGTSDPPAPTLYNAMNSTSVANFLREGIPVLKVSHNQPKKKWHKRILTLSHDKTSIFLTHSKVKPETTRAQLLSPNSKHNPSWTPSKGWGASYLRAIDFADIHFWQIGVVASHAIEQSLPHQKHLHHHASQQATKLDDVKGEEVIISSKSKKSELGDTWYDPSTVGAIVTIFHRTVHSVETLDLFIENQDHRRALIATLALLHRTYEETSQLIGNEALLLRYIWKDMELSLENMVHEREFHNICHRLQLDPPDNKEYRAFCKEIHEERKKDGTHIAKFKYSLSSGECMRLLRCMKLKRNGGTTPALDAWKACFGNANSVNAMTVLTKFLHGPQKEQSICDIGDAEDLIATMNATDLGEMDQPKSKDSLTKRQFEEFLRSELNDIYDPQRRVLL